MTPDSNIIGIITAHCKIKLETRIKIMSRVGNIIAMKRKEQKFSQGKMCEELTAMGYPIKVSAYSSWETGISFPNAEQFLAVCKILKITNIYNEFIGGYNAEDPLAELNEEGKKKALDYIHLLIVSGEYKNAAPVAISTFRELKLFDMPVSAGPGTFLDSEDYELIKAGNEVPEKTTFGVKISGNSMEPRYLNQQIVWIQQTEELVDGEIGIFLLNGNAYCKKLQNNSKGLALISLNPEYAPIKISEQDQFHIFGRVLN